MSARLEHTEGAPDLIIVGAQLWLPEPTSVTALAVSTDRIVAVGTDTEILGLADLGTKVIDVAGAAVLPGFHDAHIHPLGGGFALLGCDLDAEHSVEGYARLIREYASAHPDETWVVGSGWFGDAYPGGFPDRAVLDALIPDRPAVFTSHDAHGVWVNSRALKLAGIDATTPDPEHGQIVRDATGEPTGILFEAAGALVSRLIPAPLAEDRRAAILAAQARLFSFGITAWHDALLGDYLTMVDATSTYQQTLADGSLRARVTGSIWWPPTAGPEQLPEVLARVEATVVGRFPVRSVKIMQDGICENCTAALVDPYCDVDPATAGESVILPADLAEIVTGLDAAGISVHFHGVGDRAVRECLDAVAAARERNGGGVRHQIAHLDVTDPADHARFAALGVTANLQPLWARDDQEILERKYPLIGEARAARHFAFGSLHRAAAHLAMGSDWPVTSPDPLWGLHVACTRTAPAGDQHALNPESRVPAQPAERLDVVTAVRAYTLGSAEAARTDDRVGSLVPGKLADFVVLDGAIDGPASFDKLRVALTFVGGDTVYKTPGAPRPSVPLRIHA